MEKDGMEVKSIHTDEFIISSDLADFPVNECPAYLNEGIGAVCVAGTALIQVFNTRCRLEPDMILILLPWELVSIKETSPDFRMTFFRISKEMFTDTLSSLWRLTTEFFFYMRKHFVSAPVAEHGARFLYFCNLLAVRAENVAENYRRESIMQLLRVFYWDIYVYYDSDPLARKAVKYTRKEELAFRFMRMIVEEHSRNMDVAYYAGRLEVSPKYLTNLVKSISGQSAHDCIVYYTILEIKALLRESSMDLKAIASRVNFPDQSSLCRFFRRYAGMSPSQYRKSIHF